MGWLNLAWPYLNIVSPLSPSRGNSHHTAACSSSSICRQILFRWSSLLPPHTAICCHVYTGSLSPRCGDAPISDLISPLLQSVTSWSARCPTRATRAAATRATARGTAAAPRRGTSTPARAGAPSGPTVGRYLHDHTFLDSAYSFCQSNIVAISAVKRSTTDFHNHREGPY